MKDSETIVRDADERFMRRAIELAERGWGQVAPNPLVGAVVVSDSGVVGEGFHERHGDEHAEVAALRAAGPRAVGSTLYVNLEPCAHDGKTPPCDRVILEAGVREVIIACRDPNPEASGGLDRLEASGVAVRLGVAAEAARRLNAPFFWRVTQELPYVALKLAMSLDGRIAAAVGVRSAVTGESAWREVHRLRAGFDAVLIGRGTAVVDDPMLTARGAPAPRVPPVRVVLDSELRLSTSSRLVRSIDEAPVWAVGADGADPGRQARLEDAGVKVLEVLAADPAPERAESGRKIDLPSALRALKGAGVGTILVEGGVRVASALLREGLVRRLYLLVAPSFLGDEGVPAFVGVPPSEEDAWEVSDRRGLGRDTLIVLENRDALARLAGG